MIFKPTLMYQSLAYKFSCKNKSLINMEYICKIVNSETAVIDPGPYTIIPKMGTISPGWDENFVLKFSPT